MKLNLNKQNWQTKKLGEVCEIIAGQSPKGKYYNHVNNGLPFYQGKKEFSKKFIKTPSVWTSSITKIANPMDILMSVRAPVGPINFTKEKICIGRGLAAIRVSKNILHDYLFYQLLAMQEKIQGNKGAVFSSINKNQISNLKIILTSLSEQQQIVTKLDSIYSDCQKLKNNYQKIIDNCEELKKSILNDIFSLPESK